MPLAPCRPDNEVMIALHLQISLALPHTMRTVVASPFNMVPVLINSDQVCRGELVNTLQCPDNRLVRELQQPSYN